MGRRLGDHMRRARIHERRARSGPRRHAVGAAALVLTVALAGCGQSSTPGAATTDSSGGDPSTPSSQPAPSSTTPLPAGGKLSSMPIPGTRSGFKARDAFVYLPPIYFADPSPSLPVIEMLHGTPGGPSNWSDAGGLVQTADALAAQNGGQAPILVMPDFEGVAENDTLCTDSAKRGNSETYLTVDVPAFMRSTFHAQPGQSFGVAGLSSGAFCSLMLSVKHPDLFRVFGDYSGLSQPAVDPPGTALKDIFGGDQKAYNADDPTKIIPQHNFSNSYGWFETGLQDPDPLGPTQKVVTQAQAAGMHTCLLLRAGSHSYDFWTAAFQHSLPWMSGHLGVTPVPTNVGAATCSP
jgi:S-formylglutathione hydrolase FrmB